MNKLINSKFLKIKSLNLVFNKNLIKNFSINNNTQNLEINQNSLFDSTNPQFSKIRINFMKSLVPVKSTSTVIKVDYDKLYESSMDLIKYYSQTKNEKTLELIKSILLIYLEQNIQLFSLEKMIRLFCEIGKANVGSIASFNSFQQNLMKKFQQNKNLIFRTKMEEDGKMTQLLFYYFSIVSEISMMEPRNLNFIIEYFTDHSNSILNEENVDNKNFATICDFVWLTSLSIASILENRASLNNPFTDKVSPVLSEKGARGFMKILNNLDKFILSDKNYSVNTTNKVRLYKSLYYLRLEGIELPENLNTFMNEFKNFYQLNIEKSTTPSKLEDKFENILKEINISYEKEKKLDFASVDFFVNPDICIEVNGPSHYVFDSDIPISKDYLKMRTLRLENYDFISIGYKDWSNHPEKVKSFLQARLHHIIAGKLNKVEEDIIESKSPSVLRMKENLDIKSKIEDRIASSNYLV